MVGLVNDSSVAVLSADRTWHERARVCRAPLGELLARSGPARGAARDERPADAGPRTVPKRRRVRRPFIRTTAHGSRAVSDPHALGAGP